MKFKTLLTFLEGYEVYGPPDVDITGIAYDSRKIVPGYLFAAMPGTHTHGAQFLAQAQTAGALAVLSDRKLDTPLTQIVTHDPRLALAYLSAGFYGNPSSKLRLFGVTGTNGKTTSTFLFRSILEAAGLKTGLIGTVIYGSRDSNMPSSLTTPESTDLQEMFARMVSDGLGACAMEASSHSLEQNRVAGCHFEASVFTNLTQDHLDYHQTMENYFQSKMKLFSNQSVRTDLASVNIDDLYGARILSARKAMTLKSVSYGFGENADYRVHSWSTSERGSEFIIAHQGEDVPIRTPLMARYNAYNIAGVYAAMNESKIERAAILSGIENMKQVPGRLERIDYGQPYLILIDYAHTEDALRQLLSTVRPYVQNKLIVLFGCGGERDRGKRPLMGCAAGELADEVILTSDNPRSEDPQQIIRDVLPGIEKSGNGAVHTFEDRTEAIHYAIQIAQEGDALVLAGKGHENYQIVGNDKIHFDEREVLQDLLKGKKTI